MQIAIKPKVSTRVRQLQATHPYLTPRDIAELAGVPLPQVKAALSRAPRDKPKSRAR